MRRALLLLLGVSVVAILAFAAWIHHTWSLPSEPIVPHVADPESLRRTIYGDVEGYVEAGGAHAWLGIPYADPPVGDRRWRAPHPPASWSGMRPALQYGPPCLQWGGPATGTKEDAIVGSEDCLTLNVFAPRFAHAAIPAGAARLPVMVWIHGGGNSVGSASAYTMASRLAARQQLVLVTINYRLGILGWFHYSLIRHDDDPPDERSGNYGTLDQIQALTWVRNNIARFGGDPGRVTVFGESAGGTDVYALLASPMAKGLFQGAIAQSGTLRLSTPEQAENLVGDPVPGEPGSSNDVLLHLVKPGADAAAARRALGQLDPDGRRAFLLERTGPELLRAFEGRTTFGMYPSPKPIADGAVLPRAPLAEVFRDASRFNAVPVMTGGNRDEYRLLAAVHREYVRRWFGFVPQVKSPDRYARISRYLSLAWRANGVDEPARALRASLGPKVFVYRFDWDEEPTWPIDLQGLLGAAHALEVPFVFGAPELGVAHDATARNLPGRTGISDAMGSYWAQFAYTGAPGRGRHDALPEWSAWSEAADAPRTLVLDTPAGGGIRMVPESTTFGGIKSLIAGDPALQDDEKERCYTYARTFRWFRFPEAFVPAEYVALGCEAYPVESFRPEEWP